MDFRLPCPEWLDLHATLGSGQAFRWVRHGDAWRGVLGHAAYELWWEGEVVGRTLAGRGNTRALSRFLALQEPQTPILHSFPQDPMLQEAVQACRGLRVLRQDPWECLASFILSSTKQIPHIRKIIETMSQRHGKSLGGSPTWYAFPTAAEVAALSELQLRECGMGFRAPHLLGAARAVDAGELDLASLRQLSHEEALQRLTALRGVGTKIANCVLLFSCGFEQAFPIDTWVRRVLLENWFPAGKTRPRDAELQDFAASFFGPWAGHAQQYLFHHIRLRHDKVR